jgi:hypothetical protein
VKKERKEERKTEYVAEYNVESVKCAYWRYIPLGEVESGVGGTR